MKRNYILPLLAVMIMPFTALKAQYDVGDSTTCYNIMTNNFTTNTALNWNDPDPGNWLGVEWNTATPKRIIQLGLHKDGSPSSGGRAFHTGPGMTSVPSEYANIIFTGVNSELTGVIDLTSFAELKAIDMRGQDLVTGITVTGLNNLEHFKGATMGSLTTLDFSGLANLNVVHLSYNVDLLTSLNVSNCPNLNYLKVRSQALTNLNITGTNNLITLIVNETNLASLDVTTQTMLETLKVKSCDSITGVVGISNSSNLINLRADNADLFTGDFDFADYDAANFLRFEVDGTKVTSVNNWSMLGASADRIKVDNARLTLSNAAQIAGEVTGTNTLTFDDQTRWGGDTIYVGGMTDFPGEDTIDIGGTMVATTFSLYDDAGAQVGVSNNTGNFMFPNLADTGAYYVDMINPGAAPANNAVNLRTDTFWVQTCPALDKTTSVALTTITVGQTAAAYQWLDCDNGNAVIAGATSQSYTATANGNYAVEMTLGGVCKDTSVCVNIATVGLDELSSNTTVRAYPNPMNEQVTIELQKVVANTQVTIVNVEGKVVYNDVVNTGKISVDGSTWNNGIYIVKITNEEYTKTLKLIK
ncbi:MAG: T9SS type A sorting domain-containing protein [Vicingaceae bacterium]|nr:T9SS type A sorting domain-containing protein [Vicingaceae bacterium]